MSIHCFSFIPKCCESIQQYSMVFDDYFCEVFNGFRGIPRIPGYSKVFHGYFMVFKGYSKIIQG